jgi:hypothetical protein
MAPEVRARDSTHALRDRSPPLHRAPPLSRRAPRSRSLFFKQEMELTLVGLQNSGKTTLVNVVAVRIRRGAPPPCARAPRTRPCDRALAPRADGRIL